MHRLSQLVFSAYTSLWCLFLILAPATVTLFSASALAQQVVGSSTLNRESKNTLETATLGGGCFWCMEAVYQRVEGVTAVVSGYAGGTTPNPSYKQVCTGLTGHAEVCQITYDPTIISFDEILAIFWKIHDPTSLNKQGEDEGTQYRSVIFYHDEEQKKKATDYIAKLNDEKVFRRKVVTEVAELTDFYRAEEYHQNYFQNHPEQAYCQSVIAPKVGKFEKLFKENSKLQKEKARKAEERRKGK